LDLSFKKRRKISKDWAVKLFTKQLENIHQPPTNIYEVQSFPINNLIGAQRALNQVDHGSALWQHTDLWHTALIYIEKGSGIKFNRTLVDLISAGIDSPEKFGEFWDEENDSAMGYLPKAPSSKTSRVRMKQTSYIVADLNEGEIIPSSIDGNLSPNVPHRTHLISSMTTGVESHKGLIIDFDGWLNSNPLKHFESKIIDLSFTQDIVWTANIWRDSHGLYFKYIMCDSNFQVIDQAQWYDDRWSYIWYYDKHQSFLTHK